jgi:hypothetical protein
VINVEPKKESSHVQYPKRCQAGRGRYESRVTNTRRHLVARLMLWLRAHPHTMLVIAAAVVILAVTFGVIRG